MTPKYKIVLSFLFVLVGNTSLAATLKDGTDVPVRLTQNVNGNMNHTGETVYFEVTEDVIADGEIVIEAGTFVKGMVQEAVGRKSMGKGGALTLVPRSLSTASGELVKFERNPLSQEGRKRTGATVAHVVMWGPLGLFAKGRAAFMFRGTEFDITVDGAYELPAVEPKTDMQATTESFNVNFKEYKKKINYRKGKVGKDFEVYVDNSDHYNANDVEITAVDGQKLPKALKPISIAYNKKNPNQKVLTYAFNDIVKYALPESASFEFTVGENFKANAQLNTKWKLK